MASAFRAPELDLTDREVLRLIDELSGEMRHRVAEPRRWFGSLRRLTLARAVQGSNSIEGYNASLDDVVAAVDGEPTLDAGEGTQLALKGYRDAMTYVLQVVQDETSEVDEGLIKALHFMMLAYDLDKWPGRWRPGYVAVRNDESGEIVYEGPDAETVPDLISAMVAEIRTDAGPVLVRAAMAHLNLVMIHPFRDGNGRMARCLQTLVLARERIVAPVFSSIEEYLGRNTKAYYEVLAEVGQGHWNPDRNAHPWIRFCLTAHYHQARTHLRRTEEIEEIWRRCASLAETRGLPERVIGALSDATYGLRMRNASYRAVVSLTAGDDLSELTAGRDLKALVASGLLDPVGEKRGRYYIPSKELVSLRAEIRGQRPRKSDLDPYEVAQAQLQLSL